MSRLAASRPGPASSDHAPALQAGEKGGRRLWGGRSSPRQPLCNLRRTFPCLCEKANSLPPETGSACGALLEDSVGQLATAYPWPAAGLRGSSALRWALKHAACLHRVLAVGLARAEMFCRRKVRAVRGESLRGDCEEFPSRSLPGSFSLSLAVAQNRYREEAGSVRGLRRRRSSPACRRTSQEHMLFISANPGAETVRGQNRRRD